MANDAPGAVKTLLNDNWNNANTDSKTPTFEKVYDVKEITLGVTDYVLTYTAGGTAKLNGIGSSNFTKGTVVTIDFRTGYDPSKDKSLSPNSSVDGHNHLLNMVEEMERLIKANKNSPGGGFEVIGPTGGFQDLSDRRKRLWRFVYDVLLRETNT